MLNPNYQALNPYTPKPPNPYTPKPLNLNLRFLPAGFLCSAEVALQIEGFPVDLGFLVIVTAVREN